MCVRVEDVGFHPGRVAARFARGHVVQTNYGRIDAATVDVILGLARERGISRLEINNYQKKNRIKEILLRSRPNITRQTNGFGNSRNRELLIMKIELKKNSYLFRNTYFN